MQPGHSIWNASIITTRPRRSARSTGSLLTQPDTSKVIGSGSILCSYVKRLPRASLEMLR